MSANKTKDELVKELEVLRARLATLEQSQAERKQTEDALRQSEEQYRTLVERMNEGLILVDVDETILFVNNSFCELTGYSQGELLGKISYEVFQEREDQEFVRRKGELRKQGVSDQYEVQMKKASGETFWAQVSGSPILDANGETIGSVGLVIDLTERKRAGEAIARQASERELLDRARSALARELDLTTVIRNVVEAIHETFGYALVNIYLLEGDTLYLQHQAGVEQIVAQIPLDQGISGRVVRTGKPVLVKDVHADPDFIEADEGIVSEICVPLFVRREIVGALNAETMHGKSLSEADLRMMVALSEHVSIAIERAQLHTEVRESEERYRALFEATFEAIAIHEDGILIDANPAFEELFGYSLSERVGKSVLDLAAEESRELILDSIREGLEKPYEAVGLKKDGSSVHLELVGKAQTYKGHPVRVTALRDITERKEAEEALQYYASRLQTLHEIDRAILAAQSPKEIAEATLTRIRQLIGCQRASVTLFDFASNTFSILTADINHGTQLGAGQRIPIEDAKGMIADLQHGKARIIPDVEDLKESSSTSQRLAGEGIRSYLNIPLMSEGELIGSLNLGATAPDAFQQEHVAIASGVAGSLAIAIRQARLQEEVQRRAAELEAVRQASLSLTSSLELEEVLDAILKSTFDLLEGLEDAHIFLYQEERITFGAVRWYDGRTDESFAEPRSDGLTYTVARQGEPIVVPDMRSHPLFASAPSEWEGSIVSLPLKIGERVVGVMNVAYSQPGNLPEAERRVMRLLGDRAAVAIESARLYEIINRRHQYLTTLRRVSRRTVPERNPKEFMQAVVDALVDEFDYSIAAILLGDDDAQELRISAVTGSFVSKLKLDRDYRQPYDVGVMGWVMGHGKPRLVRDTNQDADYVTTPEGTRLGSGLVVPIHKRGKVVGVLNVESTEKDRFTEFDLEAMVELADELAVHLENVTLYEQTERHADELEQRVVERTTELNEANEHLQALGLLKDEFVANVSHELRTPIANLKLYHDLLESKPQKVETYLDTLQRETNRLAYIVEDLLQLSRMDQAQITIRMTTIDLNKLVSMYVDDRPLLAESRGLALKLKTQADLPLVHADEGLLGQAFSILLTNALNYTPSGGKVTVRTQTRETDPGTWAGFSVSDTGMGISLEDQKQLFQRFFRGSAARESGTPGTGLGLAIVKEIVERHNGHVEVDSTGVSGEGTTFSVWLPVETT
jgi:PAS domain S-box-containing protein